MRLKRKLLHVLGIFSLVLGVAAFSYWQYAIVFRGNTEPPAFEEVTNTDAVAYSLQKQMKLLKQREELVYFAFEGRASETEYGTYVIPGLKSTRTFLAKEGETKDICTSMTPQGMAVTEKYILISAYCHTHEHNSVIYVVDKESHEYVKEVVLPGKPHVGGLAYDEAHGMVWYSSNESGMAQAISISMDTILTYDYEAENAAVTPSQICLLYGIVRDSFMTFYDGSLYVGCFDEKKDSVIARYLIDHEGRLITEVSLLLGNSYDMAVPYDYATISKRVQGMAFYKDKLLLSQSYGVLPSSILFYVQSDEQLYVNENSAKIYRFPEKLEQICVEGDNLYVLFESGAYAYRACSFSIVDRVLKLSLSKMMEYENKTEKYCKVDVE